jgi:TPR repeat protein
MKVAIPITLIVLLLIVVVVNLFNATTSSTNAPLDLLETETFKDNAKKFESCLKVPYQAENDAYYEVGQFGSFVCKIAQADLERCVQNLKLSKVDKLEEEERALTLMIPSLEIKFAEPAKDVQIYHGDKLRSSQMPFDFVIMYYEPKTSQCSFLLSYSPPFARSSLAFASKVKIEIPKILIEKAKAGDANAQFELADLISKKNTKGESKEAFDWFLKAAQQGHSEAQFRVGKIYLTDCLGKPNRQEARLWLERSMQQGNKLAKMALDQMDISGSSKKDREAVLLERVLSGETQSKVDLANFYHYEVGDMDKAMIWYKRASDDGEVDSEITLAKLQEERGNTAEAEKLYYAAASSGSYIGLMKCGDMALKKQDYKTAANYYRKAIMTDRTYFGATHAAVAPEADCRPIDKILRSGDVRGAAQKYRETAMRRHAK